MIAGPGRKPVSEEAGNDRGREESPDTVLRHVDRSAFILKVEQTARKEECRAKARRYTSKCHHAEAYGERRAVNGTLDRATRLITSGDEVEDGGVNPPSQVAR